MSGHEREIRKFERELSMMLARGIAVSELVLAAGLAQWALGLWPDSVDGVLKFGLLALMSTPVVRVLATLVEYVRTREWYLAGATLIVTAVLVTTIWIALSIRSS
jgi:uncharacterized membrane protein